MSDQTMTNFNPDFYTKFEDMRVGDFISWAHNHDLDDSKLVLLTKDSQDMYAHYDETNDELVLTSDPYADAYGDGISPLIFVGSASPEMEGEEDGEAE